MRKLQRPGRARDRKPRTPAEYELREPADPLPSHLEAIGARAAWAAGYRGSWVGVAIVDSGVDTREGYARRHLNYPPRREPLAYIPSWGDKVDDYLPRRVVFGRTFTRSTDFRPYIDEFGHGTKMATIVGARPGFDGVVGLVPQVRLFNLKVANRDGLVSETSALRTAVEAITKRSKKAGIRVALFALDAKVWDRVWEEVGAEETRRWVEQLDSAGVVAVIAASDTSPSMRRSRESNLDESKTHPGRLGLASKPLNNVLVVAGHGGRAGSEQLTETSNFGPGTVHLAAPAVDVPAASPLAPTLVNGTSAAAALVAGAAALVAGEHRTWSAEKVCQCVRGLGRMSEGLRGKVKNGALDLTMIWEAVQDTESSHPSKELTEEG